MVRSRAADRRTIDTAAARRADLRTSRCRRGPTVFPDCRSDAKLSAVASSRRRQTRIETSLVTFQSPGLDMRQRPITAADAQPLVIDPAASALAMNSQMGLPNGGSGCGAPAGDSPSERYAAWYFSSCGSTFPFGTNAARSRNQRPATSPSTYRSFPAAACRIASSTHSVGPAF